MAKWTPWGRSQRQKKHADGVMWYSTASHGGFHLDEERNALVSEGWRSRGGWYEEDCEWAIVALTFPALFAENVDQAHATARDYWPDQYTAVTGIPVTPEQSHVLRERRDEDLYADAWIVTCAFGARTPAAGVTVDLGAGYVQLSEVPPGHVGVVAVRGRDVRRSRRPGPRPEQRAFLVLEETYREPSRRTALGQRIPATAEDWRPAMLSE